MDKIASFTVDHLTLEPGVYVSRIDRDPDTGAAVTTFDLRLTTPNREPVMNTAECHTIEHLGATFLRNHPVWAPRVVYFGPMGCRTGFYLAVFGEVGAEEVLPLVRELFAFVRGFDGEIPGARPEECGNYLDQNLPMARWLAARFIERDLDRADGPRLSYRQPVVATIYRTPLTGGSGAGVPRVRDHRTSARPPDPCCVCTRAARAWRTPRPSRPTTSCTVSSTAASSIATT